MSATASLLTSLAVLCMGLFAPFAIKLANRWSIERTIAYALILIGLATATRYFANTAWVMLVTALLSGIGIAIVGPLLSGYIKEKFANPSRVVGIYSLALVVGRTWLWAFYSTKQFFIHGKLLLPPGLFLL